MTAGVSGCAHHAVRETPLVLIEEARWLGAQLDVLDRHDVFPMYNIGSSTEHFRCVEQPYIDEYLFKPIRARRFKVVHVDTKAAKGVDLVGDLTDPDFLRDLRQLEIKSIMCCNLLEHVTDRRLVCGALLSMVPPGGYLFVTVPYRFPYHEDPIDTLFRPRIDELAALFPGTTLQVAEIVHARRASLEMSDSRWPLLRMIVRACAPFYRPRRWYGVVRGLYDMAIGYRVTCVVLRKGAEAAAPQRRRPRPELPDVPAARRMNLRISMPPL
jgi:hypothetical protein